MPEFAGVTAAPAVWFNAAVRIAGMALGIALVVGGGWIGHLSDEMRTAPRPPPGPASVLGGFSALAVQVLTMRASDANARGDPAEALLNFDLVMELEPEMVGAADWIADEIGASMAGDEPDLEARWGLVVEGLHVHDRCVAANPGQSKPLILRAQYALVRIAREPDRDARHEQATGESAFETARRDLVAALAIEPASMWAIDLLGIAALQSGARLVVDDAAAATERLDEARAALATAADVFRQAGLDVTSKEYGLAATEALLAVAAAPAADRPALYRDVYARFGGPDGLSALPEPGAR